LYAQVSEYEEIISYIENPSRVEENQLPPHVPFVPFETEDQASSSDWRRSPYYLSLVFGKIRDLWDNPVEASTILRVTIYFKILRDGQIIDAQVEKSSGIDLYDQSAMRAILSGIPFPPLPTEYTGEYLGIHLEFEYIQ